jgi:hypothetical protein
MRAFLQYFLHDNGPLDTIKTQGHNKTRSRRVLNLKEIRTECDAKDTLALDALEAFPKLKAAVIHGNGDGTPEEVAAARFSDRNPTQKG